MADIKVKPTRKKTSAVKRNVRVKKLQASDKISIAETEFADGEDEIDQQETECLLRSALNMKNACYEQENDQENNIETDKFYPVDRLMSNDMHNKNSYYEKNSSIVDEDNKDYVVVGCLFPNGVVISLGNHKILLRGINDMPSSEIIYDYKNVGFTKVTRPIWRAFLKTHQNWPPLLNGSIFITDNKVH